MGVITFGIGIIILYISITLVFTIGIFIHLIEHEWLLLLMDILCSIMLISVILMFFNI